MAIFKNGVGGLPKDKVEDLLGELHHDLAQIRALTQHPGDAANMGHYLKALERKYDLIEEINNIEHATSEVDKLNSRINDLVRSMQLLIELAETHDPDLALECRQLL